MSKNLIIKVISYLSIVILGSNVIGSEIDYDNYTKNPLKKVSNLSAIAPFSIENGKYQHLKEILKTRELRESKLEELKTAKSLSDEDLAILLYLVGFEGRDLKEAWAVAKKESNGRPLAYNGNKKTGDSSYGIFQINMIGNLGPARLEKFGLNSNKELLNPVTNAEIAFKMSRGGENWTAWKGITPKTAELIQMFPKVDIKKYDIIA
jgi:hypothetical protein